jgi:hypothetical protein
MTSKMRTPVQVYGRVMLYIERIIGLGIPKVCQERTCTVESVEIPVSRVPAEK